MAETLNYLVVIPYSKRIIHTQNKKSIQLTLHHCEQIYFAKRTNILHQKNKCILPEE